MSDLLSNLGIEWKVIIAQMVNFAILFFVLSKFAWKPIKSMLDKRAQEIEKAKSNAEQINLKLASLETDRATMLAETRNQTQKMIEDAEKRASEAADKIMAEAQVSAKKISEDEHKKIMLEKDKITQEIKRDIGTLLADTIEKVAGDSIDEKSRQKILDNAINSIKSN